MQAEIRIAWLWLQGRGGNVGEGKKAKEGRKKEGRKETRGIHEAPTSLILYVIRASIREIG